MKTRLVSTFNLLSFIRPWPRSRTKIRLVQSSIIAMNPANGAESPRRHSTPDYSSVTIFGHTHARAPRRTTADSQKHGWDSRTKVPPSAAATVRACSQKLSQACRNLCMAECHCRSRWSELPQLGRLTLFLGRAAIQAALLTAFLLHHGVAVLPDPSNSIPYKL